MNVCAQRCWFSSLTIPVETFLPEKYEQCQLGAEKTYFHFSCSSFQFTLLSTWNFLKHLLVSNSLYCLCSLFWDPFTNSSFAVPPLLSYLTIFLFGILLNLGRPFEALMFMLWQQVVSSSDSQMLFPSEIFSVSRTQMLHELTAGTITQLCHELRTS